MTEAILSTRNLSKLFGALVAVDGVTIDFAPGKVHAIIGPNGAGKTTLINLLCGDLSPSQGTIAFKDRDITKLTPFQTSRAGIGRSYQKSNIFPEFSCLENCWLGAQSRLPTSMRFFRPADRYAEVRARAERALDLCGLGRRRDVGAAQISHGEQRQLEIAMMLATEPELLLLDEPLAGMGTEEAEAILELLKELARDHTLVLIEHDMDAVFTIAEVLTVMVNGRVLVTGAPEEVRRNPAVQEAYLGTGDEGA
ncbi:MAG: ABC transporter ATP-binding protein [Proteobacteria bacterium]|nr:ABC transporter ATP-binding protein [Pseudomonadota bacterium]